VQRETDDKRNGGGPRSPNSRSVCRAGRRWP